MLAALIGLIPTLVQVVEGIFGPKTGAEKKATVLDSIKAILSKLTGAGLASPVPDDVIGQQIEAAVQRLKAAGQLDGPARVTQDERQINISITIPR